MRRRIRSWLYVLALGLMASGTASAARTVVSLTFDDGFSDAPVAVQILNQYGMKGTFYIISGVLGTPDYMTLAQVQAIQAAGHEIGGHTITHPHLTTLTAAQQQHEICDGRAQLVGFGFQPVSFAYPYGDSNSTTEMIVSSCGYTSGRGAWNLDCNYSNCANAESIPPADPYWVRTPDAVEVSTTLAQIEQYVINAENSGGGWVPLQFHHVCNNCDVYAVSSATLTSFASWLQARSSLGTVVETVGQVMSSVTFSSSTATIFNNTAATDGWKDPSPLEVGVKFRSDSSGFITGLRFYKGSFNTGTHTGHLWTSSGTLLATATFTGETASGWQRAAFPAPIAITANTTYVASYFTTTGYSVNAPYFTAAVNNPPLHALQNGTDGPNGLYIYSAASAFPNQSYNSSNYWVDVEFRVAGSSVAPSNPVPVLTTISPSSATVGGSSFTLTLNGSGFISSSTVRWNGLARATTFVNSAKLTIPISATDIASSGTAAVTVFNPAPGGGTSGAQTFTITPAPPPPNPFPVLSSVKPSSATAGGAAFILTVKGSNFISSSTVRWNGNGRATTFLSSTTLTAAILAADIASPGSASVTVFTPAPGGGTSGGVAFVVNASTISSSGPWTVWGTSAPPAGDGWKDPSSLEVGVRFRSDSSGYITGLRFYKWSTNTGTHIGHLWTNSGTLLGTVTFTGETASGWQTISFSTPIAVTANTTYVASYFTTTGYAVSVNYFAVAVNNAPLHALQSGTDGLNGVYVYSATAAFPTESTKTSNYWVDVVFNTSPVHSGSTSAFQPLSTGAGALFSDFSQMREFPNPWRSDRAVSNHVTFDRMPLNSTVKIFTVSAHWVKTLDAPGGSVTWDLTNDAGDSVASGFYIYLVTGPAGKTHGTFAIIR